MNEELDSQLSAMFDDELAAGDSLEKAAGSRQRCSASRI